MSRAPAVRTLVALLAEVLAEDEAGRRAECRARLDDARQALDARLACREPDGGAA